jgi:glycosyltransferase involved in cell wall biosynthesis
MNDSATEHSKQTRLVHDAIARGQAALGAGEGGEAIRWLDRAHRLAPTDATIMLLQASALIGGDNTKSADLFGQVLKTHDVREAWLGLATTRFLLGDLAAVGAALAEVLSRHAFWPEIAELADATARATGAAGWCGLTGDGELLVHPVGEQTIEIRAEGRLLPGIGLAGRLPPSWPRLRSITVTASGSDGDRHLIGSPITPEAIGRVDGHVEMWRRGLRGWAWHPGDGDTDPPLTIEIGLARRDIVASEPADGIPGLAPLARPRSFEILWADLPPRDAPLRVRGRDGRDLHGSPVNGRQDTEGPTSRGGPTNRGNSRPAAASTSRRLGLAQWRDAAAGSVILVTHDDGGGVERRVQAAVASHQAMGRRAVVLRPSTPPTGIAVSGAGLPTLRFALPRERSALLRLLRDGKPIEAELHHFLNHDPSVFGIIQSLDVPYDVHTHDYAWFCPRIGLVGRDDRYCGEPDVAACEACVAAAGTYLHEEIPVAALLERSRDVLTRARRVIAPSHDTAARMARHFPGLSPSSIAHEDDDALDEPPPIPRVTGRVLVCVAGAIGLHKGFHVLLDCARNARKRRLDLSFVVVGTTIDDQKLIDTGQVFITGPYQPEEAVDLIRAQQAALALLPSIWPETWCLGLTELWRAGLRVAAFDIGAPAERIRRTGRGFLLPLGLSPARINDALLNAARGRSFLPIRRSSAYKPSH